MGGCKNQALNRITKRTSLWAIDSPNWLSAAYKPRQLNVTADTLSRHFEDGIEWQLNSHSFGKLCQALGNPQVNVFASRINPLIPTYASWKPNPYATYVDAFSINWGQFANGYAFPPFCLLARCLQKIVLEQATIIMLVAGCPHRRGSLDYYKPVDRTDYDSGNTECFDSSLKGECSSIKSQTTATLKGECSSIKSQTTATGMQSIREHFANCKILEDIPMCSCTLGDQALINMTSTLKSGPPFLNGKLILGNQMSMMC